MSEKFNEPDGGFMKFSSPQSCSAACVRPHEPHQSDSCTAGGRCRPATLKRTSQPSVSAQNADACVKRDNVTLTGDPVVVQFALEVVVLRPERLQSQLQLLLVERLLHAQLLLGSTTTITHLRETVRHRTPTSSLQQ